MTTAAPIINDLLQFLTESPTAWHAVAFLRSQFIQNGYKELSEKENWHLEPEKKYFVIKNGTSFCAFITPKKLPTNLKVVSSHTDSPGFKLKPQPELKKSGCILFSLEVYGSPLISSWLNRDLGIAGRIVYLDRQNKLKDQLVNIQNHPLTIAQLAIHLDRDANEKGPLLNKQDHLHAIIGLDESQDSSTSFFHTLIKEQVTCDEIFEHDLFLYPLESAKLVGFQNSLLASYRIDSLASVHAAAYALTQQSKPAEEDIKMVIFWDNEEIGSQTRQGADSPFFLQLIERIMESYQASRESLFKLLNNSLCISVDLAHAVHPNYPEKSDPNHQPRLGKGIVIKSHAGQRYATDAKTACMIRQLAKKTGINSQKFASRNDIPCGTTIGPIQASKTGMPTVDIGICQLSMHSCRELMSTSDHMDMCTLLSTFFK